MDHISKALERARAERRSVRDWVIPSEAQVTPAAVETELRRVALSAELLKERHVLCGLGFEDPLMTDVYRLLRTRVTQLMQQQGWSTVGITSAGPQAGKSLTAINLAITLARDSARNVTLIDADLRRPSIADTLGIPQDAGLIDYLATDIALSDVLLNPDVDNLTILPGRHDNSGKAVPELFMSKKMGALIQMFRGHERASFVLVDLPPILLGDDVLAIAPLLDCMLVVVEEGKTEIGELQEAANLLKGFNVLGTVLNKSEERKKHVVSYYYRGAGVEGGANGSVD